MNKKLLHPMALLPVFFTGAALAGGGSAELKVTGEIAPSSCVVNVADSKMYWEGLKPSMLSAHSNTPLDYKMTKVTLQCQDQVIPSFRVIDNRAGTESESQPGHFGLGNINGTGKVGFYTARTSMAAVDNQEVGMFMDNSGSGGRPMLTLENGGTFRWATFGQTSPMAGKDFSFDLIITPTLASAAVMEGVPATGETLMDGSMTMEFRFGV
ncbi:hypothetical protein ABGT23_01890 [Enterobacter cloacae]|uniref:hypothetical protein n=1 Tax=Enterobacter cloacae TaxID=550 RepID=UPI00345CE78B